MREKDVRRAIADAEQAAKALRVELDRAKAVVAYTRACFGLPQKHERAETQDAPDDEAEPMTASRETA